MRATLDEKRFGPWALVTGASSGIGKAQQCAVKGARLQQVQAPARQLVRSTPVAGLFQQPVNCRCDKLLAMTHLTAVEQLNSAQYLYLRDDIYVASA